MSVIEDTLRALIREIIAEEIPETPRLPRPLVGPEQAGEMLGGLDKQSVYRLARDGQLRPIYTSKSRFKFQVEEIERFIREGGVKNSCLKEVPARKVAGRR